jgi:hypothetical protein
MVLSGISRSSCMECDSNAAPFPRSFLLLEDARTPLRKRTLCPKKLRHLRAGNTEFYEKLPRFSPPANSHPYLAGNKALIEDSAFRNSSLEAADLILAARALVLDCGPNYAGRRFHAALRNHCLCEVTPNSLYWLLAFVAT